MPPLVMNLFTPSMTHSSPSFTALVVMFLTSEPASGSVKQKAPNLGSGSVNRGRNRFFCSSVPMYSMGNTARPPPIRAVEIPAQPQFSSSITKTQDSVLVIPPPPYSSGMKAVSRPSLWAFCTTSHGILASRSQSAAMGLSSFSANSWAVF